MIMKRKTLIILMIALLLNTAIFIQTPQISAQPPQKGPRSDYLDIIFFTDIFPAYNALKSGMIDMIADPLLAEYLVEDAMGDPNIIMTPLTSTFIIYGINFNVNETIKTYEPVWSPLVEREFRQALAFLVNKDYIISECFEYQAERIDVPLPTELSQWWNTSVTYPNYPYEYDPDAARQLLDEAGFIDRDGDGIRNYPIHKERGWNGQNLDPLIFYCDQSSSINRYTAQCFRDEMEAVGIPVDLRMRDPYTLYNAIMLDHDYHIYVGGQLVCSFPVYLATLAVFAFTYLSFGEQFVYANLWKHWSEISDILGQHGILQVCEEISRSTSFEEADYYVKLFQSIYTEYAFEVPICCIKAHFVYRNNLAALTNERGYGIDNLYTSLNSYKVTGNTPIRMGIKYPFLLNIIFSANLPDYQCLNKIYTGLISYNPYNPVVPQPWAAQDWEVGTWVDPEDGETKTVVTYYLRKDVYWVKPVTGEADGLFTAKDYEFTCYYIYAQPPFIPEVGIGCPHLNKFENIHHIEIIDDFTVKVYMDIESMWAYLMPTYPLLPKHIWLREPLAYQEQECCVISEGDLPGYLPLSYYVVSGSEDTTVTAQLLDGTMVELRWGEHYQWQKGKIYVKTDSIDGVKIGVIWVNYWRSGDARGYYPGNLDWREILEGCGPYYVYNVCSEGIALDANRHFFLETPILGEVDWRWYWDTPGGTPGPQIPGRDSGYYKIEISDVLKCTGAYCTRGDGIPDPSYVPGADLDEIDTGHVGMLDLIVVASAYGKRFGEPP